MEARDAEVPLVDGIPLRVGILYNLKKGIQAATDDAEAEYDSMDTVLAIRDALTEGGFSVETIEANADLLDVLRERPIDIAFNIAEGVTGRGREAQIPALLTMMRIPFTGSDETTLCLALDKALCKRLLTTYRVRTPKYALLSAQAHGGAHGMRFPLIVKPNAEGSSKGIGEASIVESPDALRALVRRNVALYGQDMLAEEYIEGREFTVGVLGNGKSSRVFSPMEIEYLTSTQGPYHVYSYTVKQNYTRYVRYECPAKLTPVQEAEMVRAARRVYEALGCRDFARVDFRMDAEGKIYFIEINPLPGLAPGYSDYPMLAEFCGMAYGDLVRGILRAAVERCGLGVRKA